MRTQTIRLGLLAGLVLIFSTPAFAQTKPATPKAESSRYEFRVIHDRDGIGKFYMGREIAHVMGHQAADWLERPEREIEERPGLATIARALADNRVLAYHHSIGQ